MKNAKKFIEKELKELEIKRSSDAYRLTLEQSVAAAEVLTRAELKKYIVEYLDLLPLHLFEQERVMKRFSYLMGFVWIMLTFDRSGIFGKDLMPSWVGDICGVAIVYIILPNLIYKMIRKIIAFVGGKLRHHQRLNMPETSLQEQMSSLMERYLKLPDSERLEVGMYLARHGYSEESFRQITERP